MINGFWIQIQPEDYVVKLSDSLCTYKIRPFDAPFNILGLPAFMGYYVTHGWGSVSSVERRMPIDSIDNIRSKLTFAPLIDSTKPRIEYDELVPARELKLVYAYEFPMKTYMFSAAIFLLILSALGFWIFNDER